MSKPSLDSATYRLPVAADHPPTLPEILNEKIERAAHYARASSSPATRRAYQSDWSIFVEWCDRHETIAMPASPDVVAVFVSDQADSGLNPSTIKRRVAAIGHFHRAAGHPAPTALPNAGMLSKVMAGIRNEKGRRKNRKSPADAAALRNMLAEIKGDGLRATRDRAVLALGMAAALRRSELVALTERDIELVAQGLKIFIEHSKTDQAREGDEISVPEGTRIRPKALLLEWMTAAGLLDLPATPPNSAPIRPLFVRLTKADRLTDQPMSDKSVARLVKKYAAAAGYDARLYSGHSLRSGFLTEGAGQGATIFKLQEVSRHRTVQILSEYVRDADRFNNHAGDRFL